MSTYTYTYVCIHIYRYERERERERGERETHRARPPFQSFKFLEFDIFRTQTQTQTQTQTDTDTQIRSRHKRSNQIRSSPQQKNAPAHTVHAPSALRHPSGHPQHGGLCSYCTNQILSPKSLYPPIHTRVYTHTCHI